jgi:hypothetical protein
MFKFGLTALIGIPLTFASAKAVDNAAAANAAAAFSQFGLAGLAVAGQAPAGYGYGPFGPPVYTPAGPPVYTPEMLDAICDDCERKHLGQFAEYDLPMSDER